MLNRFYFSFALVVLALGIGLLLLSIVVWLRFQVNIPIRDTLQILPLVESGVNNGWGSISLQDWLSPISGNSHRIVVTRFLMLVDYTFLGGNNYAIYLSVWASIALLLISYVRAAEFQQVENSASRYFVVGLSLIFICSPTQYLNLVNPINASWYVAMASSAVSVLILISVGKRLDFKSLVLVCFFAAIAAFSNFAGVLTCLILPVVALHQRSKLSVLVLIFSAALVFVYFHGVAPNHSEMANAQASQEAAGVATGAMSKLATQLASPVLRLWLVKSISHNVGLQLGAPLSGQYPTMASFAVLGSVLLVGFQWLALGLRWVFNRPPPPRSVEFALVMATICLGVSCAIPLGRTLFNQPMAARYQTITMVYWLSISCLIFFRAQNLQLKRELKPALFFLACVPAFPIFGAFSYALPPLTILNSQGNAVQVLGRMGKNHFEGFSKGWPSLSGPYLTDYKEFLEGYGFKPLTAQMNNLAMVKVEQTVCDGYRLHQTATRWPGVQEITLRLGDGSVNPFLTRLDLRGTNGELGRLYVRGSIKDDLRAVFFEDRTWTGFYRGDASQSRPITAFFDPLIGSRYRCDLLVNTD